MTRKKKKESMELSDAIRDLLRRILWLLTGIYIFLIMVVMPFYTKQGYMRIGTNKYEFFKTVTQSMAWCFVPIVIVYSVFLLARWIKDKQSVLMKWSSTEIFAVLYGVAVLISYVLSPYKANTGYGDAWNGTSGWYMGAATQLTLVAYFLLVSRFWRGKKILVLIFPVVTVMFGLGYINRFGVYPIPMEGSNPQFISMIGNMNWYCGYLVTVFFAVVGFWITAKLNNVWKWLLTALLVLGFATLVTQGSASGVFVLAAMMVVLYLFSVNNGQDMVKFWILCCLLFLACVVTLVVRCLFPEAITFQDGIMNLLTNTGFPIILLLVCGGICGIVYRMNKNNCYPVKFFRSIAYGGVSLILAAVIGYFTLLVINTLSPGAIGALSQIEAFTFNGAWASRRGATYMAGFETFVSQGLPGKLFGIGPDCMVMYIYSEGSEGLKAILEELFGTAVLTNAHCEWLTILANTGIAGAVSYIGMVVSAIVRFLKQKDKNVVVFACGLGLLALTMNNIFSFQQAMNTATMFLVLGIGEALYKQGNVER